MRRHLAADLFEDVAVTDQRHWFAGNIRFLSDGCFASFSCSKRPERSFCFARLRFARNNAFGLRRCGLKFENWVKIPQSRGAPFIARFANITAAVKSLLTVKVLLQQKPESECCA